MTVRNSSSSHRRSGIAESDSPLNSTKRSFDSKQVCLSLLAAESEEEVQHIVASTPVLNEKSNWRPLDRRETNFNITSNQASDGAKALTELITNMVDAVLLKHAYKKGIDPRGQGAPRTMYEAVDKLIKPMQGGKLVNLDSADPWLREFASKNLVIGITGARNKREGLPCYTFVDNGEGQRPQNFEKTFLSLSEGNKRSIPFVQGKYNMGSSGVLGYCGRRWFKLIVSRRYDAQTPWGWTIMRRRPGEGMPIADYFIMPNEEIPSCELDTLFPFSKGNREKYDGLHLTTGTVIKLYDYQVGSKFLSFRGAREALNENLVETILPFRLLDFRQKPDTKRTGERAEGIDPRPFYGMEFLLLRSHKEVEHDEEEDEAVGEKQVNVGRVEHPDLGEISIRAIALKRKLPSWLAPPNTTTRVFHSVNGQVQYKQSRGYLTDCGFPALKDRVVVIVDASSLTFEAHNDVWKGDREHIRNTTMGELYREQVTQTIKDSQGLKSLQHQIALQELETASKTERNDLFQKLVDADKNLAFLLTKKDPVLHLPAAGGIGGADAGKGSFSGKYSPTYLRFEEKVHENVVEVPINRTRPIAAKTDVENGYLDRADNRGHIHIPSHVTECFSVRTQLHNGRMTFYFSPLEEKVKIGQAFSFEVALKDDAMPIAVGDSLRFEIVDEVDTPAKPPKPPKPHSENAGNGLDRPGEGRNDARTHGLPKHKLLTKDGRQIGTEETEQWPSGFNEHDGGTVRDVGSGEVIYLINYDNAYHLRGRLGQRGDIARDAATEKYILGMRILMLGFEHSLRIMMKSQTQKGMEEYIDDIRRIVAKGAASTVLTLAEHLPKIVDVSIATADTE